MIINDNEVYGIIYKITNNINNKVYIGQTIKPRGFLDRYPHKGIGIERVYKFHKNNKNRGYGYNEHLFCAIEKYGFDAFSVDEVFDVAMSEDELNEKEILYIHMFDSFYNGYNQTLGGGGTSGMAALSGKECPVSRSVCQISTDGKLIKIWDCISDVEKELGIDSSKISCVCRGQRNTTQNYVWVYLEDYDENKDYSRKPRSKHRTKGVKKVLLLDDNGMILQEFESVNDAARKLKTTSATVSHICLHKKKRKPIFNLIYKDEYIEEQRLNEKGFVEQTTKYATV